MKTNHGVLLLLIGVFLAVPAGAAPSAARPLLAFSTERDGNTDVYVPRSTAPGCTG